MTSSILKGQCSCVVLKSKRKNSEFSMHLTNYLKDCIGTLIKHFKFGF